MFVNRGSEDPAADRYRAGEFPLQHLSLSQEAYPALCTTARLSVVSSAMKQRTDEVSKQSFEKLDDLLFGDAAFVQAKAHAAEAHAGDEGKLMPVEVKLAPQVFGLSAPTACPDPGHIVCARLRIQQATSAPIVSTA